MADGLLSLVLPADARSPQRARDFVTSALGEWPSPETRELARLLTSELVTNAVMHARTDLTVTAMRDEARNVVRVTVTDGSPAKPRHRRYSRLATTGRGLSMVDRAAQAFGVETHQNGKSIWFELALSEPASPDSVGDLT